MSTNKNMKAKDFGKTKVATGKMPESYKLLDQLRKDRRKLKTKYSGWTIGIAKEREINEYN